MRIFIAGATGVLGIRVVPLLVADGHDVWGMTRTPSKSDLLWKAGAEPVVCDVYDLPALRDEVVRSQADAVLHLLTDLPDDASAIEGFTEANARIRREGTRNLLTPRGRPERPASSRRAWRGSSPAMPASPSPNWNERCCTSRASCCATDGSTGLAPTTSRTLPDRPRVHVDEAARRTALAIEERSGVIEVVDLGSGELRVRRAPTARCRPGP